MGYVKKILSLIRASVDIRNHHLLQTRQKHYRLSQMARPISETFVAEFPTCSEIVMCLPAVPNFIHMLRSYYMSCQSHP
jgi:hypothetical protein